MDSFQPAKETLLGAPHGCASGAGLEVGGRMKTIIEMAGEAGIFNGDGDWSSCREEYEGVVQRFAELVRADERADLYKEIHDPLVLACKKMVADEREACADLCYQLVDNSRETRFAAAIRARGNA